MDIAVLAPVSDIDIATVPGLRSEVDSLIAAGTRRILLNCENVTFIDSTGLAFLLSRARRLIQEGGMLSLVNVSAEVSRFLQIARLISVLHVTARDRPPVPVLSPGTLPVWSRSISVAEGIEHLGLYRHRVVELLETLPLGRDAVYDTEQEQAAFVSLGWNKWYIKLGLMRDPSSYLIMADAARPTDMMYNGPEFFRNTGGEYYVALRHNGKTNAMFLDGHVRSMNSNQLKDKGFWHLNEYMAVVQ